MGSFFIDLLSFDHEVAVYEKDAKRLRFTYNCYRFTKMEEVEMFRPELVINAVTGNTPFRRSRSCCRISPTTASSATSHP